MTIDQKSEKSDSTSTDVPPPLPTTAPPSDADIQTPGDVYRCTFLDEHQAGKEFINVLLDMMPEKVYNLIYTNETFFNKILNDHKCNDIVAEPWQPDSVTKELTRKVTFTAILPPGLIGPPSSNITEIQTVAISKPNELYVVNKDITNAGIPYADNFKVTNHTCITKEVSGGKVQTRLKQYGQVIFKKSTVFFVRSMIEKNAVSGAENVALDLQAALIAESKGQVVRRRKKPTNTRELQKKSLESASKLPQKDGPTRTLWCILLLLLLAGLANTYLYFRLNQLEQKRFMHLMSSGHIIRDPNTVQEEKVRNIYEEEEDDYNSQISRWQDMIEETVSALDEVEESFIAIKNSAQTLRKRSVPIPENLSSREETPRNKENYRELPEIPPRVQYIGPK